MKMAGNEFLEINMKSKTLKFLNATTLVILTGLVIFIVWLAVKVTEFAEYLENYYGG